MIVFLLNHPFRAHRCHHIVFVVVVKRIRDTARNIHHSEQSQVQAGEQGEGIAYIARGHGIDILVHNAPSHSKEILFVGQGIQGLIIRPLQRIDDAVVLNGIVGRIGGIVIMGLIERGVEIIVDIVCFQLFELKAVRYCSEIAFLFINNVLFYIYILFQYFLCYS